MNTIVEDGFSVLRNVIPKQAVNIARRTIYAALDGDGLDPAWLAQYRTQSFAPELRSDPRIQGLFSVEPLISRLSSTFGRGNLRLGDPVRIRINFPTRYTEVDDQLAPGLDGLVQANEQFPNGDVHNYTALLVAQLTDARMSEEGGIWVWPGAHKAVIDYCKVHGVESLAKGFPEIALPEPKHLDMDAGDVAVIHFLTPRAYRPNRAAKLNTTVEYKARHVDHYSTFWNMSLHWNALRNPWKEWIGLPR